MQVVDGELEGVVVLRPEPRHDDRGFFVRTLDTAVLRDAGLPVSWAQENQSRSRRGTLRGLHLRGGRGEGKLVRCSAGAVHDVIADLRPASPTFRRWQAFRLDDVDHLHVYVPPGVAHGFQALTDVADVNYHHDRAYDPDEEVAVAWDDPDLGVTWPLPPAALSHRDSTAPPLAALLPDLRAWFGAP